LQKLAAAALATFGIVGLSLPATAQNYPDRPVRIVVPYAPGGGGGAIALMTADYLSKHIGQNVVVENKPGAGSALGLDLVAKSKPDGYTLALMTSDGISILPAVKKSMPYKVPDDFAYLAGVVKYSYAFALYGKLPHKSMTEVLAWAKANPGKFRYATAGIGGGAHLMGALVEKTAGVQMVHVPYNGGGPAITGVVGGHVDAIIVTPAIVKPHHDTGALRAVATTDKARHPNLPEAQTLDEAGLKGLVVTGYYGFLAPAGTPEPILDKLRSHIKTMLDDPGIIAQIDKLGFQRAFITGEPFKKFLMDDLARWKDVAVTANISLPD
jgi:tripartite-type tricarboxylate transporter receptor subunit TctC